MSATARSNKFPPLTMAGSDNNAQPMNKFGGSTWDRTTIWGSVGALNYRSTASAGSDDLSPTAPSGPSQLSGRPETGPWGAKLWTPRIPSPNSASPTRPGGSSFMYHANENGHNTSTLPVRPSVNQARSGFQNRAMPPGPVEGSNFSSQYTRTVIGGMVGEERDSSALYMAPGTSSHLSIDASALHRRSSVDPGSLGVGQSRPGTFSGRQPDTMSSSLAASPFAEAGHYPYPSGTHARQHSQRHSAAAPSPPSPSDTRGKGLAYPNALDINDIGRRLTIHDNSDYHLNNAPVRNGLVRPVETVETNPNLQHWQDDMNSGVRTLSHGNQQDAWIENSQPYYPSAPRASIERSSPASVSYRHNLNSQGNMSENPVSRNDVWNRSTPRNPAALHEHDRMQQGSQYPNQSSSQLTTYFNSSLPSYPPYEPYTQIQNYRPQLPASGFPMPLNYAEAPVRSVRSRDAVQGARSKLLEDFRNRQKTGRQYELKDIYGHVVEFSGDQHGSRFIQDKLEGANSEEKEHLFEEIHPNAIQLMKDVFGNYVIQKFFDYGSQVQKKLLARQMEGQVAELSLQMYSCRVVQKALEHVLVEQQERIVEELNLRILPVAMDQNGNHVVQKIIHMFPRRCIPVALAAFRGQIESLATHGYVCRVIQRILEHCTPSERESLMAEIHPCAAKLMTDQYGNYVIQHVIQHGQPADRRIMIQHVIDRALALSKHKYASNIVEKCVQFGEVEDKRAILAKLRTPGGDGVNPLPLMMKDQFANYVVQRLIEHLKGAEKNAFVTEVRAIIPALKKDSTGRQNTALDRLTAATDSAHVVATASGDVAASGSAPSSPGYAAEVSSASPTPFLSTEQNSPQSSSPPSTHISTTGDSIEEIDKGQILQPTKGSSPVLTQEY